MFDIGEHSVVVNGGALTGFLAVRLDGRVWEFDTAFYEWLIREGRDTDGCLWEEMSPLDKGLLEGEWELANAAIDRREFEQAFAGPSALAVGAL